MRRRQNRQVTYPLAHEDYCRLGAGLRRKQPQGVARSSRYRADRDCPQFWSPMMAMSEGYGQRFGDRHGVAEAPAIVTRVLRTAVMAVTELRSDYPSMVMSGPLKREDAFLVSFLLRDFLQCKLWEDGRLLRARDLRAGQVTINDLRRDPRTFHDHPCHTVFFYLPRSALNAIADDAGVP